jgi:hypothetical protein
MVRLAEQPSAPASIASPIIWQIAAISPALAGSRTPLSPIR